MSDPESDITWNPVCESSAVAEGRGAAFTVNDERVAVFRHEGKLYALDEMCTHADASLAFGHLEDGCVVACPWHYAQFDLATGRPKSLPAVDPRQSLARSGNRWRQN